MRKKPKNDFQRIERECIARGASIRRATKANPYRHYVSGFVIKDVDGRLKHCPTLNDVVYLLV